MAQYKVPQDVEADDKLLGPFSFRQFVYLLIAAGCIALAVAFWQIFPALAIIPALPALFFIILALPLKKDQPMETYLAAIVSYYLKPRTRTWTPGQRDSTIMISAPKNEDDTRARDLTGEEATHRLSFLADIVDTEGQAIKGMNGHMNEDIVVEANTTSDIFENNHFDSLESTIAKDENARHEEVVREMREAIRKNENLEMSGATIQKYEEEKPKEEPVEQRSSVSEKTEENVVKEPEQASMAEVVANFGDKPDFDSQVVVSPDLSTVEKPVEKSNKTQSEKVETESAKPSIIDLANNPDFSIATIAKEANRIKERDEGEVFISLH
ncbi:PrgI family protein [Candidatus Saccharibacteria bacterium]|nr:PrgI family protein [Candidatus Saccharibacteria bacterium]